MRLAARLMIAGLAVAGAGTAAGCSGVPAVAYARDAAPPPAATASASPSASPLASPLALLSALLWALPETSASLASPAAPATPATPATPAGPRLQAAGPRLQTVGVPRGVKAKEGILVDDATGQVLWTRGQDKPRPIASITKVMTALIIIAAGNLGRKITVPKSVVAYVAKYGGNAAGLVPGQVFTVDELLRAMLIMSACDAAYTLANAYGPGLPAFIAKMNAEAARLGLAHTHFTSPDGLPYPTETSTYSTPTELVALGEIAMRYPAFRSIVRLPFYALKKGHGHGAYWWGTSNELIGHYRGVVGIKTGYTDDAGHTLLFEAVRGGRTLIGVVLGSPLTGKASGAQDAAKILNWGFSLKQAPSPFAGAQHVVR
jgi:D-alanyl-D-alanine carboxypeptidase (penicillin-binding protein 5/6)